MTEQTNAELIAKAEQLAKHSSISAPEHADMLSRLAERLEETERQRVLSQQAWGEELMNYNKLAAVVVKVWGAIPLSNPELIEAGYAIPAEDLIEILSEPPADILRKHDVKVQAEEREKAAQIAETFHYSNDHFVTEVIAARIREQEAGE